MFKNREHDDSWRDGVFLCQVQNSFQADILESKLKSEGIPCIKKYIGAGNYLEIFLGQNTIMPIEIYVPKECLEDAQNIIIPIDLDDCEQE